MGLDLFGAGGGGGGGGFGPEEEAVAPVGCWSYVQGRPMKATWFDALVFDPRFGGRNCLSVVQALQAELGNLMAVRQNLCLQISVCWLQCLAGKELVIFKFDF